jgi:hypothetical protein
MAAAPPHRDPAALRTLNETDIPDQLHFDWISPEENWPGQYLLPGQESRDGKAELARSEALTSRDARQALGELGGATDRQHGHGTPSRHANYTC